MNILKVKPKDKDTIVRMPEKDNKRLAKNGEVVPDNSYWRRRLKDGDIELVNKTRKPTTTAIQSNTNQEK